MPSDDAWDWPLLVYIGTVLLKRSERQFWKMTPRKLSALTQVYADFKSGGKGDKTASGRGEPKQQVGFIDQVI